MQAIITKYLPATNTRGSRIKATAWRGSATIAYDYSDKTLESHRRAAQALCEKMGWPADGWIEATAPISGFGYVFVRPD